MGEFRGSDAFGKLLSKSMSKAVSDIPLSNCSPGAVNYFLKNTYGKITWKHIAGTTSGVKVKDPAARPKRVRDSYKDRREKKRLAKVIVGEKVIVPLTSGGGGGRTPTQAVRGNMTRGHYAKKRERRRRN